MFPILVSQKQVTDGVTHIAGQPESRHISPGSQQHFAHTHSHGPAQRHYGEGMDHKQVSV